MGIKKAVPLSPEVYEKFCNYYIKDSTRSTQSSNVRELLRLFNEDLWPKEEPATILNISSMPIQRLIDCLSNIALSNKQKVMTCLIITLAGFEEYDELVDNDEYNIFAERVFEENIKYRNSITLDQTIDLRWVDIIRLSTIYIDTISTAIIDRPIKYYTELNSLLLITMIRDMPVLRVSEYCSIMLEKDDSINNNYFEISDEKIWTLVIRTHKMKDFDTTPRRIPVPESVIIILDKYRDVIWDKNMYLLRKLDNNKAYSGLITNIIKTAYNNPYMGTAKLRILSASYYHDIYSEKEQRQLAYYMGHTYECHLISYVRQ